jgi:hypothetical protein
MKPRWSRLMKNDTKPRRVRLSAIEEKWCDVALAKLDALRMPARRPRRPDERVKWW